MNTRGLSVLSITAVVIVCQQGTVGGVTPPPFWAGNAPNNTTQTWGFGSQWGSDNGNEPDAGWHNPNGVPGGSSDGATEPEAWLAQYEGRNGVMRVRIGKSVNFDLPNTPDDMFPKRVWIQVIYRGDFTISGRAWNNADPPQATDLKPEDLWRRNQNLENQWKEAIIRTWINPNPTRELFTFTQKDPGNLYIDSISFYTICGDMIPGPSGLALGLAFASLGVTRRRRVAAV